MVSIVGNTLTQLATACAQEIGPCQPFTALAGSAGATQIISGLFDGEAPVEKFGGYYVYNVADSAPNSLLGEQGRVTRGGYNGAASALTLATNLSATPHVGASWLLLGTMPVLDQDGLVGIRTCVNRAIRKFWTIYRYPITSTGSTVLSYDLGSLFWASKDRFRRLLDPDDAATGHNAPSSTSWQIVESADVWTLQLGSGFPTGDIFYLECEVPLNYRLYLNGAWANQSSPTAGLVLGADACLGEWDHVFQCSLYECMKQLAIQAGGNRKAHWAGRVAEQRAVVSAIKLYQADAVEMSLGEGPEEWPGASGVGDRGFFTGGGAY